MRLLKKGSRGEAVRDLQVLLAERGFSCGKLDGIFGTRTLEAVREFQDSLGLKADGIVGPKTWAALEKNPASNSKKKAPRVSLATYRYLGPNVANQNRAAVIDDETALWAARMCVGEGGEDCSQEKAAAMLWALLNRWFLHPAAKRNWPSYLFLMRRFSQPINPRWLPGGDLALKYAGTEHCTPGRLARRVRICSLKWQQTPAQIAEAIKAFQEGRLPPPAELLGLDRPRISNWASHEGLSEKYPWGISFDRSSRQDWFFEDVVLTRGSVVTDFWG